MTYLEMKNSMINALANFNSLRLRELSETDRETFEDILNDIQTEMGITINRFWDVRKEQA